MRLGELNHSKGDHQNYLSQPGNDREACTLFCAGRRARATRPSSHRGGIRAYVKMEVIDLTDAKPEGTKKQITIKREVEVIDLTLSDEDD